MTVSSLLVLLLSNAGFWFGGHEGSISVAFAARENVPASDLNWALHLSGARLATGKVALGQNDQPTLVRLTPPRVRVRSTMRWSYRLLDRATGKELEAGEVPIHVFPDNLLAGVAGRFKGKRLVVISGEDARLSTSLATAEVAHDAVNTPADLALDRPDVVLVARDALGPSPFEQSALLAQAKAGAGVIVFRQSRPRAVVGYRLARRAAPKSLKWREQHPLFADVPGQRLDALLRDGAEAIAIQLPADEPALELAWWPRESAGTEPAPIDALVVSKSVGAGRLVLCQLSLGDWDDDPRAQLLLANALDYLLTRPEPTPAPSQRTFAEPVEQTPVPTITIPKGDIP